MQTEWPGFTGADRHRSAVIWDDRAMTPTPNPGSGNGTDAAAHDVLAAEEFAMPVADPTIRPHPVILPDDPTGIPEPHDVLAAEEFAMPAVPLRGGAPQPGRTSDSGRLWVAAGLLLLTLLMRRRRRRRRVAPAVPG
jgi:hypothetical protein